MDKFYLRAAAAVLAATSAATGAAIALSWLLVLAPVNAHAQASSLCAGRGFIDSVYQTGMGGNTYMYYVQVRNQTASPMRYTLTFANLPKNVNLNQPGPITGSLNANAGQTLRFGSGSNGDISKNTVLVHYDAVSTTRPSVLLSNCVAG